MGNNNWYYTTNESLQVSCTRWKQIMMFLANPSIKENYSRPTDIGVDIPHYRSSLQYLNRIKVRF